MTEIKENKIRIMDACHIATVESNNDIAIIGNSSPYAPCIIVALPILVPILPESFNIGNKVPKAVEAIAKTIENYIFPFDNINPRLKEMNHVTEAFFPCLDRISDILTSNPANKKRNPIPNSRINSTDSVTLVSSNICGPIIIPKTNNHITSGIYFRKISAKIGESIATKIIHHLESRFSTIGFCCILS